MNLKLLEKFYQGECTEEEAAEVQRWFDSESDKEKVLDYLQAYWQKFEDTSTVPENHQPTSLLDQIHARVQEDAEAEPTMKPLIPCEYPTNRWHFLRVAAIILLAFGGAFLAQNLGISPVPQEVTMVQKAVPDGEKLTVQLADGTQVILNAGSRLSYPVQFASGTREVRLEGEAFFEVVLDERNPFVIVSGNIQTTVLGTSFNIKAYADEPDVRVSVISGKVKVNSVRKPMDQQLLTPGREAVYQKVDQSLELGDFNKQVILWKDGVLHFQDATFEDVKSSLERWYGVEISVAGQRSEEWEYSGSFTDQSLENVLLSISYVKQFAFTLRGKQVNINFSNP